MDFQKPSTRSETANAVTNIIEKPKKCTVCHGTNQMTWLISDSMAGLQPAFGAVGSASVATRISGGLVWPPRCPVSAITPTVMIWNASTQYSDRFGKEPKWRKPPRSNHAAYTV